MSKIIPFILDRLKTDRIKPPYFHNLNELGFGFIEVKRILEEYYGGEIQISNDVCRIVYSIIKGGLEIYQEEYIGTKHPIYTTYEYVGENVITTEGNKEGEWTKSEYDEHENRIYYERSNGYWERSEYDEMGKKRIYLENGDGILINNKYETDQQDKTPRNH